MTDSKVIVIRQPYDGQRNRVTVSFDAPDRAKQAFADECDINNIVRRFEETGLVEHVNGRPPRYEDLVNVTNYYDAMLEIRAAEEAFMDLPARIREQYDNDPGKLIEALHDPAEHDRLVELGVFEPEALPEVDSQNRSPAEPSAADNDATE